MLSGHGRRNGALDESRLFEFPRPLWTNTVDEVRGSITGEKSGVPQRRD